MSKVDLKNDFESLDQISNEMEDYRLDDFDGMKQIQNTNKSKRNKRLNKDQHWKDKVDKIFKTLEGGKQKVIYYKYCSYCGQKMRGDKCKLESHYDGQHPNFKGHRLFLKNNQQPQNNIYENNIQKVETSELLILKQDQQNQKGRPIKKSNLKYRILDINKTKINSIYDQIKKNMSNYDSFIAFIAKNFIRRKIHIQLKQKKDLMINNFQKQINAIQFKEFDKFDKEQIIRMKTEALEKDYIYKLKEMRKKFDEDKKQYIYQNEQKYNQDLLNCQNNINIKQSERDKKNIELKDKNDDLLSQNKTQFKDIIKLKNQIDELKKDNKQKINQHTNYQNKLKDQKQINDNLKDKIDILQNDKFLLNQELIIFKNNNNYFEFEKQKQKIQEQDEYIYNLQQGIKVNDNFQIKFNSLNQEFEKYKLNFNQMVMQNEKYFTLIELYKSRDLLKDNEDIINTNQKIIEFDILFCKQEETDEQQKNLIFLRYPKIREKFITMKKELLKIKKQLQNNNKDDYYINKRRIQDQILKIDLIISPYCPEYQEIFEIKKIDNQEQIQYQINFNLDQQNIESQIKQVPQFEKLLSSGNNLNETMFASDLQLQDSLSEQKSSSSVVI